MLTLIDVGFLLAIKAPSLRTQTYDAVVSTVAVGPYTHILFHCRPR